MPKCRVNELDDDTISTPTSKRTRPAENNATPSKATPSESAKKAQIIDDDVQTPTKKHQNASRSAKRSTKISNSTPTKPVDSGGNSIYVVRNADRSARRKSTRNFIQHTIAAANSDEDIGGDSIAQEIWGEQEERSEESEQEEQDINEIEPETPSKRGRGRPRKSERKRTPSPPSNLLPHERYFFDNRPSAAKSSSNTFSSADIISHSAYHSAISAHEDSHRDSIENLHEHHASSFPLWAFELSQQFSVCLYGYGSKKRLLESFATYLHSLSPERPPTTIIINGHHPNLTIKSLLATVAMAILPAGTKHPAQPPAFANLITAHLTLHPPAAPIYLLLSVLHTRPLITNPAPSVLAQLASHPSIHLLATADNPSFPLLYPTPIRDTFNFLFHDASTFLPYDTGSGDSELSTVVDSVLELIGRKTATVAGREGVRWVLRSLPENARGLYRILVSEILTADAEGTAPAMDTREPALGEDPDLLTATPSKTGVPRKEIGLPGVDAKMLYQKATQEFLCSSEMMFWNLLKEFLDHRMVILRKERGLSGGGEILGVEMGREELEGVLEDLCE